MTKTTLKERKAPEKPDAKKHSKAETKDERLSYSQEHRSTIKAHRSKRRGFAITCTALIMVIVALVCCFAWYYISSSARIDRLRSDVKTLKREKNSLSTEFDNATGEHEDKITELEEVLTTQKDEISIKEKELSEKNEELLSVTKKAEESAKELDASKARIKELEAKVSKLEKESAVLSDKAGFLDKYIRVVDSDKVYHKYGCSRFDDSSFWAYNKFQVEGKSAYKKCYYCN